MPPAGSCTSGRAPRRREPRVPPPQHEAQGSPSPPRPPGPGARARDPAGCALRRAAAAPMPAARADGSCSPRVPANTPAPPGPRAARPPPPRPPSATAPPGRAPNLLVSRHGSLLLHELSRERPIGGGRRRPRVVLRDGLPEPWRLGHPDRPWYDTLIHLGPEVLPHLRRHVLRELRATVEHREDD